MEPATSPCNDGLAALSFASGCTDVLTFLKLGNVFTSAMTGNAALLAVEIGRGQLFGVLHALTALLSFALGVALAAKLNLAWGEPLDDLRRFNRLLLLELVFLISCAAVWSASLDAVQGGRAYTVILLSAMSMGIQAVAARSISPGINTIVFTSALVHMVMSTAPAIRIRDGGWILSSGIKPYLYAFAAYFLGALLAAVLVSYFPGILIWVPAAAVMFALRSSALARKRQSPRG